MFSKQVALFLVVTAAVLFLNPCPPAAVAQFAASIAHGPQSVEVRPSSLGQTSSPQLRRGPVTPADLALRASQNKTSKSRRFGNGPLPLSNSIFLSALDFNSAGLDTHSVAYGDLNGDGKVDLVLADQCSNENCPNGSVSVLLGNGDGTFQTAVSYNSGGEGTLSVVVGDVNGDGKLDVILANSCNSNNNCTNGSVSVLLGNGDGTLQSAVNYDSGANSSQYVALGDVNGDGKPDVLVANDCVSDSNCSNGTVSVLLGNGDGTFQTAVIYNSGGQNAVSVVLGDVNGDGKPDAVVANSCASNSSCSNGSVSVLLGNGDGTFQAPVSYSSGGQSAGWVVLGDVNGDGKPDVVVANNCVSNSNDCSTGLVAVLLGNGDGTFQQALGYSSGGDYASSVAIADINGDGKPDLLVANQSDSDGDWQDGSVASVLLGNGDGTFQTPVSYASGDYDGLSLEIVDVNGDQKLDVVMANQCVDNYNCSNGAVSVMLGNGDGTLNAGVNYNPDAWDAYGVTIADVNGDGKLDLLVANTCNNPSDCTTGEASVLLGNGDGTFQTAVGYSSGGIQSYSIVSADVNADGKPDLLIANLCVDNNCATGSVSVLLGNGDGTFQSAVAYGTGGLDTFSIAVADVNGDGKPDLLVANECANDNCSNGTVAVLLGNGDGTFQTAVTYSSGAQYAFSIAAADVNGDGKPDLLVANQCVNNSNCSNGEIGVLLGNGDGTFQTAVDYSSGGFYAFTVAVADMNGDGKPDLVVANQCGNDNGCNTNGSIGVLLGNGDGTFQTATTTSTPILGWVQSLVLADFNGDKKIDVASGVGDVLLLGNGDGTLQSPISLGASGPGVATGDVNGDGRPDLAIGGVSVLLNTSNGFVFPTTTTVASSTNPSEFGQSITFTATVTAQVTGTLSGTVTFSDGATVLGQGTLTSGTASLSVASLAIGSHSITASYSGNTGFTASVSTTLSQIVQTANTVTTLSAVPSTANLNQSVTLTATVTPGTSGVPTGTVSFLDGTTQIGSSNLNGSGVATLSTANLTAGTHSLTAVYGGDSNFNGSTSTAANVVVANPQFSLSSSTLSPASVTPGASARSTITIAPTGGFNPSTASLSCSVSPVVSPAVTCSLGAISVTSGTGSSTLTVSTTGPVAALQRNGGFGKLIVALLIPGLFVCGAGKSNRRKLLTVGFICLVLTGCMLQTACLGTSSSNSTSPGTPAGSYTVTVTGSGSGTQQTTSVSLTVQ
jgi:hypothetical protein